MEIPVIKPEGDPVASIHVVSRSTLRTHPRLHLVNYCGECGEYWPLTAFPNRKRSDGRLVIGKQCRVHYNLRKRWLKKFRSPHPQTTYQERCVLAAALQAQWDKHCAPFLAEDEKFDTLEMA